MFPFGKRLAKLHASQWWQLHMAHPAHEGVKWRPLLPFEQAPLEGAKPTFHVLPRDPQPEVAEGIEPFKGKHE